MRILLSAVERYGIFHLLNQVDWGGSEDALLSRDAAYVALRLRDFEEIDPQSRAAETLSRRAEGFDVDAAIAGHLRAVCCRPGQSRTLGRQSASIVRRLIGLMRSIAVEAPPDPDDVPDPVPEPIELPDDRAPPPAPASSPDEAAPS